MMLELVASGLVLVLAAPYLWHALRLPGWAHWRTGVYLASCALLWWCLAGTPALLRVADGSWGVVGVALADVLVGFGLVVAAPIRLWEEARGRRVAWIRSPLIQMLGFPLVSATLNGVLIVVAFNSSWFARSRSVDSSWIALIGACLVGGFLANLQLLSPDLVPGWLTPGLRMALSLVDGLLDELPGIIVAGARTDEAPPSTASWVPSTRYSGQRVRRMSLPFTLGGAGIENASGVALLESLSARPHHLRWASTRATRSVTGSVLWPRRASSSGTVISGRSGRYRTPGIRTCSPLGARARRRAPMRRM